MFKIFTSLSLMISIKVDSRRALKK